jgi:hypothetical protein
MFKVNNKLAWYHFPSLSTSRTSHPSQYHRSIVDNRYTNASNAMRVTKRAVVITSSVCQSEAKRTDPPALAAHVDGKENRDDASKPIHKSTTDVSAS